MPQSIPAGRPESAQAPRTALWKKLYSQGRQHWIIRELKALEVELQQWRRDHPDGRLPTTWLLRFRGLFRSIIGAHAAPSLSYYLATCSTEMRPLAVWLVGRSASRTQLYDLPYFAQSTSPVVRRHAARALRRLEAWSHLDRIAKCFPEDERLQWYAAASVTKRTHDERMRSFMHYVESANAPAAMGPSRMPLWFAELDWIRRPPKSVEYIRRILRRIHRLVHGRRT